MKRQVELIKKEIERLKIEYKQQYEEKYNELVSSQQHGTNMELLTVATTHAAKGEVLNKLLNFINSL